MCLFLLVVYAWLCLIFVYQCVHTLTEARSQFWASSSSIALHFMFWSRVSHCAGSSLMRQDWQVSNLKLLISLCLPMSRIKDTHHHTQLLHKPWDLNSGPHTFAEDTFPIEATFWPTLWVLTTSLQVSWASPLPLTKGVFQPGEKS